MPFGYSSTIFPHPPVQYIPLVPLKKILGEEKQKLANFKLFVFQRVKELREFAQRNSIKVPSQMLNWAADEFCLLTLNGELLSLYYRGSQIRGVGIEKENHLAFWLLSSKYFYRQNLLFLIFNEQEEELASVKLNLIDKNHQYLKPRS